MKIILANPSVAPHVKQSALAYEEAGMLDKFCTTFFRHKEKSAGSFPLPESVLRELNRRSFDQLPPERFMSRPFPELLRIAASRFAGPLITDRIWEWAETGFDAWVADLVRKRRPDAVHVYEHAALESLQAARKNGVMGIYEQTSAHHATFSKILQAQLQKYPQIRTEALALKTDEKSVRRNARRDRELQLADVIICNSTFTARSLQAAGISMEKIIVLPLGFPEIKTSAKSASGPVVFLHAGNQSVTKASHLVYEAWRQCAFAETEAELWLIGNMALPENCRADLPGKVVI
ncbi:MAG: hypothetical protein INR69_18835, partial [Mucilaginibacter polytrichastri]|nr:hypothetical protein [Mucilaginibacter polytrichastri]